MHRARELWHRLEALHAVVYFAEEARTAFDDAGLRGFWMGYFAGRAAPLGPVTAPAVTATFFNFHPRMVNRAIPDAWLFADPATVLDARRRGTAAALERLIPDVAAHAVPIVPLLDGLIAAAPEAGRPLFAANRAIDTGDDPVARLWQAVTALREHRGDGHVAVLTSLDLDGCEAHVLAAAWKGIPPDVIQSSRGWSDEDWKLSADRLRARGWLDASGALTARGRDARVQIERQTDALAWSVYSSLDDRGDALLDALGKMADGVLGSDLVPFPNPMGLPKSPDEP